MPLRRTFLGWDGPVVEKVCRRLLPRDGTLPIDLGHLLVVVPTRQAGRRLRQKLAETAAELGSAVLAPRVVQPSFFMQADPRPPNIAGPAAIKTAWVSVLVGADVTKLQGLFPVEPPDAGFRWALRTGELIQRLRDQLVGIRDGPQVSQEHQRLT